MYRPNFCAECGTRVERERWRPWTSRSFCPLCARRFQSRQILLSAVVGLALFGLGLAAGRFKRPGPPPLIIERAQQPSVIPAATPKAGTQSNGGAGASAAQSGGSEPGYGPDGTAGERPTDPHETISICGARTQRGTPCQRRVRGTGRCWQHKGMPAMLPPDKLVVKG
ncbi:MAG TPA: hypothetical protein VF544_15715 [Pyrinomonadaceae bacterium]|jgi:hypothetical protein